MSLLPRAPCLWIFVALLLFVSATPLQLVARFTGTDTAIETDCGAAAGLSTGTTPGTLSICSAPVGEVTLTFDDAVTDTAFGFEYKFESGLDVRCDGGTTSGNQVGTCYLGVVDLGQSGQENRCNLLADKLAQATSDDERIDALDLYVNEPGIEPPCAEQLDNTGPCYDGSQTCACGLDGKGFWGGARYWASEDPAGATCFRESFLDTSSDAAMPIETCTGGPALQTSYQTATTLNAGTTYTQNLGKLLIVTDGLEVQFGSRVVACAVLVEKTGGEGDPHLSFPHGGRGDFRGREKTYYNFLSSQRASLNVMTQNADFQLHDEGHPKHKHVHGSFLTQAHIVARTNTGQLIQLSYYADLIGKTNMAWVNGTVDADGGRGRRAFKLGVHTEKAIDDVTLEVDYSTLRVTTAEFEIAITPINLRGGYLRSRDFDGWALPNIERNVSGLHHRLDISIKLAVAERNLAVAPHGIIGQGWDGDDRAIDGEQDVFPESGEFTTYAMAKGALEGVPDDYVMAAPYATAFKFSRFDAKPGDARPRDVAKLVGAGELNPPQVGAVSVEEGDFVGATERAPTQMQKREL